MGGGAGAARRPARRRAEHRLRGGRPSRRRAAGGHGRAALPEQAPSGVGAHLRRPEAADRSVRERARRARRRRGERVFVLAGPDPRAVRRGARDAQARQRVLPAVLGVRAGADRAAAAAGRRAGAGDDGGAVPPEGRRACASGCPGSSTCCSSASATRSPRFRMSQDLARADGRRRRRLRDRPPPRPRTWRCCISPAARPARRRARFTCTRRSSRIARPAGPCSTCAPATCSGAPPTRAG